MQLFYYPQPQQFDVELSLEKEETRHITKVLRKKIGDQIHITNGKGDLFEGTITAVTSNRCTFALKHLRYEKLERPQLHIAIAPTKMNDRMEWFLEKATELGIYRITPILSSNSERRKIKIDRFEKIIVSAMQQSLQLYKPILDDLTPLDHFVNQSFDGIKLMAHCEPYDKKHLKHYMQSSSNICLLIGPEGDFTPSEIEGALNKEFKPVHLGETRLRTETAGVYGASLFNALMF